MGMLDVEIFVAICKSLRSVLILRGTQTQISLITITTADHFINSMRHQRQCKTSIQIFLSEFSTDSKIMFYTPSQKAKL